MSPIQKQTIVCILPRLGATVGGGKIAAVFQRMNLLAERENTDVVLLNVQHGVRQKIAFAQLQADGRLSARIRHLSLHEFCIPEGFNPSFETATDLPPWDQQIAKAGKKQRITYLENDQPVMRDTIEDTAAGRHVTRQILTDADRDIRLKYLGTDLIERLERWGDGIVHRTLFAQGHAVCEITTQHKAFRVAKCFVTGETYETDHALQRALVEHAFPPDCVVFIDGITTAYLSRHISAKKVLFLHADHRAPNGNVVPRSRYLIENFDGTAIATATHVHKTRLEADINPAAPIRVVPHFIETTPQPDMPRRHICTVSRLELTGKPIHQAVEAFTRVMHRLPGVNYLIFGTGLGEARLRQLIAHHECQDRVHLMGYCADTDAVFAQSVMSLAPTMTEGFGLALLESLTHGCPVITYDVDYGPRELVQPGQNGERVAPGDIDALAQAILKVHARAPAYSVASRQSVSRYSYASYRRTYFNLIDEVIEGPRFFDISAPDLKAEVLAALESAPRKDKSRLLDLYIARCAATQDVAGMYAGFQHKHQLFPNVQRPLMRCIWLSRKLGKREECRTHLTALATKFPKAYRDFISRYPDFETVADESNALLR